MLYLPNLVDHEGSLTISTGNGITEGWCHCDKTEQLVITKFKTFANSFIFEFIYFFCYPLKPSLSSQFPLFFSPSPVPCNGVPLRMRQSLVRHAGLVPARSPSGTTQGSPFALWELEGDEMGVNSLQYFSPEKPYQKLMWNP